MPSRANTYDTVEGKRLVEPWTGVVQPWRRWGPYVAERAWATVREDYSPDGEAWDYFPHDLARSKAYRWGEDGLAAICDRYQVMVLSLALWNGQDGILKERLFGLVPDESNHGEDVKEYYYYLDSTPTHSYLKYQYKYPHRAFPYRDLIERSGRLRDDEPEYELIDTGVFADDRYFDVVVEYAKAGPEDISVRIEVFNRGPEAAAIHVMPHMWFRNTWGWDGENRPTPRITVADDAPAGCTALYADDRDADRIDVLPFDYRLSRRWLYGDASATPLFTDNETNAERVFGARAQSRSEWVKDGFHRHIVDGEASVNPQRIGTKACLHHADVDVPAGGSHVFRLRFSDAPLSAPLADVDAIVDERRADADRFYDALHAPGLSEDERLVQRQALAGMLWTKQVYLFDVGRWFDGDNPRWPPPESRGEIRNERWRHLNSMRVLSMPDKWEYPWFAAWDLAFHTVALALVDGAFAKDQLWLLLFEQFQHPNGQIPAYEWEFSDLNPPVHAWAVWRVYNMDRIRSGRADRAFLERCFHKLLINFAWWVNKVDSKGNNVFEGGFLGLDNITVLDRSEEIPGGAILNQSDGTGWMGMFCLNLMRIALELAHENPAYEWLATKFFQHYVYIGAAMKQMSGGSYELWSERDGFFYDALSYPDGTFEKFRLRSLVGLIPLYAVERLEESWIEPFPRFRRDLHWFLEHRADIARTCVTTVENDAGTTHVLAVMAPEQMRRLLGRVWDPEEFRSDYGLRSLSKAHATKPFRFGDREVRYDPGEAIAKLKGGNSNWRGPVWFPTSFMMIESLRKLQKAYGTAFTVPSPVDGEADITLDAMARGFADRLIDIFVRGKDGRRPVFGDQPTFQNDPHWRDLILFYEYFHGDDGHGLGASHQTGWTGLVANLLDEWR